MEDEKEMLELEGYEVITGNSLHDIPEERIKDLDLLIAHLHQNKEKSLVEQAGLRRFHDAKFKIAVVLGANESVIEENRNSDDFGKLGNRFYMKHSADIVDAVRYFLEN